MVDTERMLNYKRNNNIGRTGGAVLAEVIANKENTLYKGSPQEQQNRETIFGKGLRYGNISVSYTHLTLPTICSV